MKVLVIGAAGNVGQEVAINLRKRGLQVWGLVRNVSPEKVVDLLRGEVHVIQGDVSKPATFEEIAKNVDVIINATKDFSSGLALDEIAYQSITQILQNTSGPKKLVIFTSGGLVYENSTNALTEDSPPPSVPFMLPRLKVEQNVMHSKVFNGVVVRCPTLIGGSRGHWTVFYQQAIKGKVEVSGTGENVISFIHIEDLADGYAKIVEAESSAVTGQIFHFAEPARLTLRDVAKIYAEGAGHPDAKIEVGHPWPNPLYDVNMWFDVSKAKRVLGWTPNHQLARDTKVIFQAWKTYNVEPKW
eukprot:Phypoly_transcript_09674.p1 GENE.Phypoly_transcript_09674~~Phypoly_transcript_09674.p1  ORF type:complete len:300 (+),score=45.67 Phypoly_transcript_09674:469-1368(+)